MTEIPEIKKAWVEMFVGTIRRTRTAFFLSTVASSVVLLTAFNLTLSWSASGTPWFPEDGVKKELAKEHIKHQVQSYYYQLPLLGIQIDANDLGFFAPLALLIFSFYYLSATKAAHRQLSSFLNDRNHSDTDLALVAELASSEVFPEASSPGESWHPLSPKLLYSILVFLPFFASVCALLADAHSYFVPAWDNSEGKSALQTWLGDHKYFLIAKALLFDILGCAFTFLILSYNRYTHQHSQSTRKLIDATNESHSLKARKASVAAG